MDLKPRLSFWQIWNMSFGFLGIQFGFALQNANVSRIFETLGAEVDDIPILWVAAPLTGLIIQPIIGYFSDRTWTRLGRRRPYFLAGALLASISLLMMPNSPALWFAAGTLWLLDASINISMEPFRAFVGDNLPSRQRTAGFAMQSFFIGTGAIIASSLPYIFSNWLDISNQAAPGIIPDSVKWSFYIGGVVFLLAVIWTILRSKEYSPDELANFAIQEGRQVEEEVVTISAVDRSIFQKRGLILSLSGVLFTTFLAFKDLHKELYIFSLGLLVLGILYFVATYYAKTVKTPSAFVTIMLDIQRMPITMKHLSWVQFFSWFSLFSMWIYMTPAVTSHLYGSADPTSKAYNDGADWVGLCMGVYNGVAAVVAFLIPIIASRTSRKITHALCLLAGGLALLSIYLLPNPDLLMLTMVGIGIAWASILSVPYAMLAGALPPHKMGYFMGLFNFFIVLPQIVAAALLGFLIQTFFNGEPIFALVIGGASMCLAAALTLRVEDVDEMQG